MTNIDSIADVPVTNNHRTQEHGIRSLGPAQPCERSVCFFVSK